MQQDKNIENKLKQLDSEQQPDFSQMDEHWQQMQAMLQPNPHPIAKSISAKSIIGGTIIGLLILAGGAFLFNSFKKGDAGNDQQSNNIVVAENKNEVVSVKKDTSTNKNTIQQTVSFVPQKIYSLAKNNNSNFYNEDDSILSTMRLHIEPCNTCPNKIDSALIAINRIQLLKKLFGELEKKDQQFEIDNKRDTLVFGNEGTSIFIPAYAFNGIDSVIVSLTEYYKYSDMVLNRLITKSDDEQLISGGMFNIEAKRNGNPVLLNKENPLMVFIPGIAAEDSFKVFTGTIENNVEITGNKGFQNKNSKVNWKLTNMAIDSPVSKLFIRAIDLRDNTASVSYGAKTKAVFTKSKSSVYSKEQLKELLQKKYGSYYDKIKVRQQWDRNLFFQKIGDGADEEWGDFVRNSWGVGDTAELTPLSIRIYKLQPIDTVHKILFWRHLGMRQVKIPILTEEMKAKIGEKYSIQLNKLGWVNCDRFNNVSGSKTTYIVDLKDSSYNYYTIMVFDKYKSVLSGTYRNGTMVSFSNIPVSEPFKIISVGIDKAGHIIYAMKEGICKKDIIDNLQFESTSVADLKASLSKIDK